MTAGGGQRAVAGQQLLDPVAVTVVDHEGHPVSGIGVDWSIVEDSDVVEPDHSVTDSIGIAKTAWTLGPLPGEHTLIASVAGYGAVTVSANADPAPLMLNSVHLLRLETPDGSGQTVHPDFANITTPGPLQSYFLGISAYPLGNFEYENPSVYTSLDLVHWNPPDSATNPVAFPQHGYLSDPDIVFNPATQELWMYYRQVDVLNEIMLTRTSDGVRWSEPELMTNGLNHTVVSPSVVRRDDNDWLMWSVNGQAGCTAADTWVELRRSQDGRNWSAPERVQLSQPGFTPWHIDVQWIPSVSQYWAVYNVKTPESCATPALYLATSTDGVRWTTYPSPVLVRGDIDAFSDIVYRSTFRYRPETDVITFWYSGARYDGARYVWQSAVQRRPRADVFAAISRPPSRTFAARIGRHVVRLLDPP